ncbi:MAG: FHA domain-containing protein [Anaerolineae bacterium]|nr:FHA domain-containing protein [Anaerolineae bacterium]
MYQIESLFTVGMGHHTMTQQLGTMDVFIEYVSKRKAGGTRDATINDVQAMAQKLTKGERVQLTRLIQMWEARDGKRYTKEARAVESPAQPPVKPASPPLAQGTESPQFSAVPNNGSNSAVSRQTSVIRPIDPVAARDPSQRVECPNCGRVNSKKDVYCYSCGQVLNLSKPQTKVLAEEEVEDDGRFNSTFFDDSTRLLFMIPGVANPIEIEPPREEIIIGRSESGSAFYPDIDLATYNAADLGVSRLHASLRRRENTIAIIDLGSRNHTYVNGHHLYPHEVRVLRHGDEVQLGSMTLKVVFKHVARWVD